MSITPIDAARSGGPDLRRELRDHLDAEGISIAEAANGIGMSAPAVSAWLRDAYRGDNDRMGGLVGRWLATERAVAERRSGRLDRHAELTVTEQIGVLALHAQATADLVLVYGAAGAGKTWALRRHCEQHSEAWFVSMSPAVTTPAAVLARIGRAVDAGGGETTAARLEVAVTGRLRRRSALLVVDEAHHLSSALLDVVRCVYDEAACGLVLAGNEPLWTRLASGDRAAQLVSRVGVRHRLRRPTDTDAAALAAAQLGRAPAGAGRRAVLEAAAGMGGLRAVTKLVTQATVLAAGAGRAAATDADVVDAAAHMGAGL